MASTREHEHIGMQMDEGLDPAAQATQELLHKEMSGSSLVTSFTLSPPQRSRISITKDKTEDGKKQQASSD